MNTIGIRISTSWNNQCEAVKLSLIVAGNVALGLKGYSYCDCKSGRS